MIGMIGDFFEKLNIYGQCRKNGIPLWQCPQFLFMIMGLLIIIALTLSYLIGNRYITDPVIVALITLGITLVLLIIAFIITRSFERLAEVSRMKSEFINIISHQLRSPLTNLKWAVDFLNLDEIKNNAKKKEEYSGIIKDNITRMVELVDDLLIVSKLEQGKFPLRKKDIFFEDLIESQISRFKIFAKASNVKIDFYPQKNLPKIFVDPSQMKLVVENLIDNAIHYIKNKGAVKIWLEKKGKYLLFKIKDTGVGIPEEDQKYIFQKFFRAENVLREQTRGSGLGLYIVKSIIEKSGGKIWFESGTGKGTTFYFILPIK